MISLYFIKKSLVLRLPAISICLSAVLAGWPALQQQIDRESNMNFSARSDVTLFGWWKWSSNSDWGPTNGVNIRCVEHLVGRGGSNVAIPNDDDDDGRKLTTNGGSTHCRE